MENNTTENALAQFISNTVKSYTQAIKDTQLSVDNILNALMKVYNSFLLQAYTEALKEEVNKKVKENKDGKPTKKDNK